MTRIRVISNSNGRIAVNTHNYRMLRIPRQCSRIDKEAAIASLATMEHSTGPGDMMESFEGHRWSQLYLILTGRCNLQCGYCAQHQGTDTNMSHKVMTSRLSDFLKTCKSRAGVVFYGGEPLLNWPVLQRTVTRIRNQINLIEVTLFTNGTLINQRRAKWLAQNRVGVIVSIDGNKAAHDQMRGNMSRGTRSTHSQSVRGYDLCRNAGCTTGISCVLGPHNVPTIAENTEFLCALRPANLGMNLLHSQYRTGFQHSLRSAAKALITAMEITAAHEIEIEQVARILRSLIYEQYRVAECPACGGRIVVTPTGEYGTCEGAYPFHKPWFFKDVYSVYRHGIRLKRWASNRNRRQCSSCIAYGMCGSGCALNAYLDSGGYDGRDTRTCVMAMAIVKHAMSMLLNSSGNDCELRPITVAEKVSILGKYISNAARPLRSHSDYGLHRQ